jgi:hypothetical protein
MSALILFALPADSSNSKGHSIRPPRFEQSIELLGESTPLTCKYFPSFARSHALENSTGSPLTPHPATNNNTVRTDANAGFILAS